MAEAGEEVGIVKLWRTWKVTWTVITNLLVISVALALFSHTATSFERIVVCLLVLTYQAVNWGHTAHIRLAVEEALTVRSLILGLYKLGGEDTSNAEEELERADTVYKRQNKRYFINLAGATIIYCIVVWNLIATVFF